MGRLVVYPNSALGVRNTWAGISMGGQQSYTIVLLRVEIRHSGLELNLPGGVEECLVIFG